MRKKHVLTEKDVMEQLEITDWRNMTKDKIISFANQMPYMDQDVARAALEQFPEFTKFSYAIIEELKGMTSDIVSDSRRSNERAYEINEKIFNSLDKRLSKRFLLPGERKQIINAMLEISSNINELDYQHKHFLSKIIKTTASACGLVVVLAAAVIGVNISDK